MEPITVTKYKCGFKVTMPDSTLLQALDFFNKSLTQPKVTRERGRVSIVDGDKYYVSSPLDNSVYYGNWHWLRVMEVINAHVRYSRSKAYQLIIEDKTTPSGFDVVFDNHTLSLVEPEDSDYNFQNDIVDFAVCREHSILEVQTGKGKTALSQKTVVRNAKRVLYLTKAGYITKWTGDLTKAEIGLKLKPKELLVIAGVDNVDNLLEMGRTGELNGKGGRVCKAILMSSNTFDLWIDKELNTVGLKNILTFMEVIGCDFVVYDETHEQFRMNYISFMLLNPNKAQDLSATIINNDPFISSRYGERLNVENRYTGLAYDIYAKATSVYYYHSDKQLLKSINSLKMYNHNELEKKIMRKPKTQDAYFDAVYKLMELYYFKNYQDGQKALVFFSSKEMCTRFSNFLKIKHPELIIARNIQGDNFNSFIDADIGVSTPIKSGTAVDIPGLVTTFCTVALGKEDKNLQILGRLRKVKKWEITPRIVYMHCPQIKKHMGYLNVRFELIKPLVLSFDVLNSKIMV